MSRTGGTFFATPNEAWSSLGPVANAFLFSPRGEKYLKALLKYHVVVNQTLYTDAFYREETGAGPSEYAGPVADLEDDIKWEDHIEWDLPEMHLDGEDADLADYNFPRRRFHVALPTLLADKRVIVDIARWPAFVSMRVNRWVKVGASDLLAKDGVIHTVRRILLPPHPKKKDVGEQDGEVSVEELIERLEDMVVEDGSNDKQGVIGEL
jgi:Fasciclin domain